MIPLGFGAPHDLFFGIGDGRYLTPIKSPPAALMKIELQLTLVILHQFFVASFKKSGKRMKAVADIDFLFRHCNPPGDNTVVIQWT